ncbi:MAG TPA: acyl transferase [Flavobacteriales bacterium]|nr:acyl transferase [Flavobacteriales bacterium]HIL66368.1 acyl transferase [Flavobacteriales bacterium]
MENLINKIMAINSESDFEEMSLKLFDYQMENNLIYAPYAALILKGKMPANIYEIPFLPIEFFKQEQIICQGKGVEEVFLSSGTTGEQSKHLVADLSLYKKSYLNTFQQFYGDINDYCILALLPSYQEREGSSLIYMVDDLIKKSGHPKSGFYLNDLSELSNTITELEKKGQKTILFGVTYALLDLAAQHPQHLKHTLIMETGGVKGKRKELLKEEIHKLLEEAFLTKNIHSEYGMTELLSQSYSKGKNIFKSPPWMKILVRDVNDPLSIMGDNKKGGINVIDLANIHSCPFIATQDLGRTFDDNSFSVLGRFDNSDVRGCNLLIQ